MNQKIKAPKIVIIFSLTLITILFWAGFEVYRSITTKPTPPVSAQALEPVNPVLDAQALSNIQTRIHLDENQIAISTPRATEEPVVATISATPTSAPLESTVSGEVQP